MVIINFDKYDNFENNFILEKLTGNVYQEYSWYFLQFNQTNITNKHAKILNHSEYERFYSLIIQPTILISSIVDYDIDLYIYCDNDECKKEILKSFRINSIKYVIKDVKNDYDNNTL